MNTLLRAARVQTIVAPFRLTLTGSTRSMFFSPRAPPPLIPQDQGNPSLSPIDPNPTPASKTEFELALAETLAKNPHLDTKSNNVIPNGNENDHILTVAYNPVATDPEELPKANKKDNRDKRDKREKKVTAEANRKDKTELSENTHKDKQHMPKNGEHSHHASSNSTNASNTPKQNQNKQQRNPQNQNNQQNNQANNQTQNRQQNNQQNYNKNNNNNNNNYNNNNYNRNKQNTNNQNIQQDKTPNTPKQSSSNQPTSASTSTPPSPTPPTLNNTPVQQTPSLATDSSISAPPPSFPNSFSPNTYTYPIHQASPLNVQSNNPLSSPYIIIPIPASNAAANFTVVNPSPNTYVVTFENPTYYNSPPPNFYSPITVEPTGQYQSYVQQPPPEHAPASSFQGEQPPPTYSATTEVSSTPPVAPTTPTPSPITTDSAAPTAPITEDTKVLNELLKQALQKNDVTLRDQVLAEIKQKGADLNFQSRVAVAKNMINNADSQGLGAFIVDTPMLVFATLHNDVLEYAVRKDLECAKTVLASIARKGGVPSAISCNAVLDQMKIKNQREEFTRLFNKVQDWGAVNATSYEIAMRNTTAAECEALLKDMRQRLAPTTACMNLYLAALEKTDIPGMKRVFEEMKTSGPSPDSSTYACMMRPYQRNLEVTASLFEEALTRGLVPSKLMWDYLLASAVQTPAELDKYIKKLHAMGATVSTLGRDVLLRRAIELEDWTECQRIIGRLERYVTPQTSRFFFTHLPHKERYAKRAHDSGLISKSTTDALHAYVNNHLVEYVNKLALN